MHVIRDNTEINVYAEWEDRGDKPTSEKQPDANYHSVSCWSVCVWSSCRDASMLGTNHGQGEDGRGRHLSLRDRMRQQKIRKKRLILNDLLL